MDLTTLAYLVLLGLGIIGTDAVIHHNSVVVEVSTSPKTDKMAVDQATLTTGFKDDLYEITRVNSLQSVVPPEIRMTEDQGVGMAIAKAVNLEGVAYALQDQFRVRPDTIRFSLYIQDGQVRGFIAGHSRSLGYFHNIMVPKKDEALMHFVHRCALWSAEQLAPYATALYLMHKHAADGKFDAVVRTVEQAEARLPPTPRSFDRALFDNLLGLVALFRNDVKAAQEKFRTAMLDDPTDPVPFLNAALTDLQIDDNRKAADRMQTLLRVAPPQNDVLRMTAYMTWGAALMGLKDLPRADRMLRKATQIDPQSATAFSLWAEEKRLAGDTAAAARLDRKAQIVSATFENYAEVGALWFHLSWRDNEPVIRNKFTNPTLVGYR
jgi:tetratricopeptide (TPR) repeat protein